MDNMVNLEEFAGGALAEKFNDAYREVLENILDPNTEFNIKRKLTLELNFTLVEDRELSVVDISTKTKLAPPTATSTTILIDRDGQGEVVASEYNNQIKGQQYLRVDEETGEMLDEDPEDLKGIKLIK